MWGFPKDDPSWKLYKDKPWTVGQRTPQDAKIYAAMINMVDRQVGEMRDLLVELDIAENTIIFFSGDNGGQNYFKDEAHPEGIFAPNVDPKTGVSFRGYKGSLYEGGLRIPFMVHWPAKIPGARVSVHLGYFPDMMPTLANLCGALCPPGTDGISFAPTLLGAGEQKQHDYLYWEYRKAKAVRMGDWKAINTGVEWHLYDLQSDVSESQDVAAENPDIVSKITGIAKEAHEPVRPGKILDSALAGKDRRYMKK